MPFSSSAIHPYPSPQNNTSPLICYSAARCNYFFVKINFITQEVIQSTFFYNTHLKTGDERKSVHLLIRSLRYSKGIYGKIVFKVWPIVALVPNRACYQNLLVEFASRNEQQPTPYMKVCPTLGFVVVFSVVVVVEVTSVVVFTICVVALVVELAIMVVELKSGVMLEVIFISIVDAVVVINSIVVEAGV